MVERVALELWDGDNSAPNGQTLKWYPLPDGGKAMIYCGNGHLAAIPDHEVDEDGNVTPSLLCGEKDCGWHVYGKLIGWGEYGRTTT